MSFPNEWQISSDEPQGDAAAVSSQLPGDFLSSTFPCIIGNKLWAFVWHRAVCHQLSFDKIQALLFGTLLCSWPPMVLSRNGLLFCSPDVSWHSPLSGGLSEPLCAHLHWFMLLQNKRALKDVLWNTCDGKHRSFHTAIMANNESLSELLFAEHIYSIMQPQTKLLSCPPRILS